MEKIHHIFCGKCLWGGRFLKPLKKSEENTCFEIPQKHFENHPTLKINISIPKQELFYDRLSD